MRRNLRWYQNSAYIQDKLHKMLGHPSGYIDVSTSPLKKKYLV